MFNIIKYLAGLRIDKKLIIMFYVLSLITSILAVFLNSSQLIYPPYRDYGAKLVIFGADLTILYELDDFLAICCGLAVFLTLHKLSITIRLVFGEIRLKTAKKYERCGEVISVLFVLIYLVCIVLE